MSKIDLCNTDVTQEEVTLIWKSYQDWENNSQHTTIIIMLVYYPLLSNGLLQMIIQVGHTLKEWTFPGVNLATGEFFNFEMCKDSKFWLYIDFKHFNFLGYENANIASC